MEDQAKFKMSFCGSAQEEMDGTAAHIKQPFIDIKFQLGPVKEVGANGTTIEEILGIAKARLEGFQKGAFRCRTNALSITKIEEAIMWLEERTKQRVAQGVEGLNQAHEETK